MKKRAISVFLCIVICISIIFSTSMAVSTRDTSFVETLAVDLKGLGLFEGVSDTDFDLNREPTRIEALVMLIRVLGKESVAMSSSCTHPFTDVPDWADKYVGYAYENGLTKGSSATEFGTGDATAVMYLTFVLRSLGYSDANGADFTWDNPYALAKNVGILPDCVNTIDFWRADAVIVSYAALPIMLKGATQTLAQKLIAVGAFTGAEYDSYYDDIFISERIAINPIIKKTVRIRFAELQGKLYQFGINSDDDGFVPTFDMRAIEDELYFKIEAQKAFSITAHLIAITTDYVICETENPFVSGSLCSRAIYRDDIKGLSWQEEKQYSNASSYKLVTKMTYNGKTITTGQFDEAKTTPEISIDGIRFVDGYANTNDFLDYLGINVEISYKYDSEQMIDIMVITTK